MRRIWRLSFKAHCRYLPILATFKNLLFQMYARTQKFVFCVQSTENVKIRLLATVAKTLPESVTATNLKFLSELRADVTQTQQVDEDDIRICSQIRELNESLDGSRSCNLDHDQILHILFVISAL